MGLLRALKPARIYQEGMQVWSTMRVINVVLVDKGFHALGDELCVLCECFSCQNVGGIGWNTGGVQSRKGYVHRWEPRKDIVRMSEPLQKEVLCSAGSQEEWRAVLRV